MKTAIQFKDESYSVFSKMFPSLSPKELWDLINKRLNWAYRNRMIKVEPIIISPKFGRNDICICGSGLKYKKCCGRP